MDRETAITAAKAMIEAAGLTAEDLFPAQSAEPPKPDIDALLPRKRWVPEEGGDYYYSWDLHHGGPLKWDNGHIDKARMAVGNVFRTAEEAKERIENMKAWLELRERSDNTYAGWAVEDSEGVLAIPGVGFSSTALRDLAVDHIGQDRIDELARWFWNVRD
jgi:hypothetical protein